MAVKKWPVVGALVFHALTSQVFFFFSLCQTCNWPATEMTNNIIVVKIQCYIDS